MREKICERVKKKFEQKMCEKKFKKEKSFKKVRELCFSKLFFGNLDSF